MGAQQPGFRVRRAGHVVIRCRDPERTAAFFQEVAGFTRKGVVQRGMHFLTSRFDENHHMLLVRPAKPGATAQDADDTGRHGAGELRAARPRRVRRRGRAPRKRF